MFLALAALLLVLAVACEEEEEEGTPTATGTATPAATRTVAPTATPTIAPTATPTVAPTATPTAAETATPTAEVTVTPAVTPTPPAAEEPGIRPTEIILGTHFAQSGTYGAAFAPVLAGMKAYFNYVNAEEGGVCDRQIVFKTEDDQYDPAQAVGAIRKLVEQDEVFAIIGGLGTAAHSAVWEYLNEEGIPDLWIMSGAHKWAADPEAHPWSVAILPDYYVEATIVGKYISENLPGKKVGIIYQNDDYGKDELAGLKNGLDPTKNELVSEQSYESTAVDIRSQVTNLKNAGAEVVHGACIPGHCAQLVKAADQMDWDVQIFIGYVNSDPAMFQYAGNPAVMEGVITLQANKMYDWTDDAAVAEHHRIMKEYGDLAPGNFTIVGQEAGELTVAALRATCDNLTREGLLNAVNTIFKDYQGALNLPGVTTTLTPTDHLATETMKLLRATLVDGKGKWEYFGDLISFAE
jgi:branched-chain amino acid transport system substrate-binding protein